jgi:GT2 family glycosyltransferase
VSSDQKTALFFDKKITISGGLNLLATQFPQSKIVWCNEVYKKNLNLDEIDSLLYHDKMMLSYNPSDFNYLGKKIGYIDESPFIKVNKNVRYPTWQMSSDVGIIHSSVLIEIYGKIKMDADFDYYLNSMAKLCMPLGLLCYSEPRLLLDFEPRGTAKEDSHYTLFRFVKQHYKTRWVFLLFMNLIFYERKFSILEMIYSGFYKNRNKNSINLDAINVNSTLKIVNEETIDVIVPTIGRRNYLYDFLCDLRNQKYLPKNVIIVEQNPLPESVSELDYLTAEKWPFIIKHTFTHQTGACNARNLALSQVESNWVFFADDDIRIMNNFIQKAFENIKRFGVNSVSFSCLKNEDMRCYENFFQWSSFGSGCSFVNKESFKDCNFKMGFEFGFGEDSDFGMQLRNNGEDVIYFPEPNIIHLKAPVGGFRIKPILEWEKDIIKPKPSPTVMLYQLLHNTHEQRLGYKLILFFKYYKYQMIKNPIAYLLNFNKQWNRSVFWANELNKK